MSARASSKDSGAPIPNGLRDDAPPAVAFKERPTSFVGPMVRAILADRKTQTRRVIAPQPEMLNSFPKGEMANIHGDPAAFWPCPYDVVSTHLRVRESFRITRILARRIVEGVYLADGAPFMAQLTKAEWAKFRRWKYPLRGKPPMYCFRSLSRLWLRLESVRAERVQDLSDEDAKAEGIEWGRHEPKIPMDGYRMYGGAGITNDPRLSYRTLWDSINAERGYPWESNPWVWALTFRRVERP